MKGKATLPAQPSSRRSPRACVGNSWGFTLAELMIVVSVIGLLAVLAVPYLRRVRMRVADTHFLNDLRVVSAALEQIALAKGDFPEEAAPATPPPGWEGFGPRRFDWRRPTPIGGQWDWDRAPVAGAKVHGCYAGISVLAPERTSVQMTALDARFDNGDLASGEFRSREGGYIWMLEP